jgi:hypothetical protein
VTVDDDRRQTPGMDVPSWRKDHCNADEHAR